MAGWELKRRLGAGANVKSTDRARAGILMTERLRRIESSEIRTFLSNYESYRAPPHPLSSSNGGASRGHTLPQARNRSVVFKWNSMDGTIFALRACLIL